MNKTEQRIKELKEELKVLNDVEKIWESKINSISGVLAGDFYTSIKDQKEAIKYWISNLEKQLKQ